MPFLKIGLTIAFLQSGISPFFHGFSKMVDTVTQHKDLSAPSAARGVSHWWIPWILALWPPIDFLLFILHAGCVCVQAFWSGNWASRFPRRVVRGFTLAINPLGMVSPFILILRESQRVSVTALVSLAYSQQGEVLWTLPLQTPPLKFKPDQTAKRGKRILNSVSPWHPDFLCPYRQHCCSKSPELAFFSLT